MANMRPIRSDTMIDPITGKVVPRPKPRPAVDMVTPKELPAEVTQNEYNSCLGELARIRKEFAALQPGQRNGKAGDKLMRAYRHESLKLNHLSGEKAPPIYSEMG